jgi:hypothetical protein
MFQPKNSFFNQFFTQNTIETMMNLFMTSKNNSKNQNQTEFKNQLELRFIYSRTLKVKKKSNMNSFYQIKPFHTNIICFLLPESMSIIFFSLSPESSNLSLLSQLGTKK